MDFNANAELVRHGLPRSNHIARQLKQADYDGFDYILGMDMDNYYRIKRAFGAIRKRRSAC